MTFQGTRPNPYGVAGVDVSSRVNKLFTWMKGTAAGGSGAEAKLATLQVPVSRLLYSPVTDHLSAAAIAAATWTDIHANQNFTVPATSSWFAVVVRLGLIATGAGAPELTVRALFDSAGTALGVPFGMGMDGVAGGWGAVAGGMFYLTPGTFAATGTHTVKLQFYANGACTAYCRPSSQPNNEFLAIHIVEMSS